MNLWQRYCFIFFLLAINLNLRGQDQAMQFKQILPGTGLSNNVRAVIQDSDGFMWFGTEEGLFRYDGSKLKSFYYSPNDSNSISDNTIQCLFEDSKQMLWIGTQYSGLCRYDKYNEQFTNFRHDVQKSESLSHNYVWAICEDSRNNLWVGTEGGGLSRFISDEKGFKHFRHQNDVKQSICSDTVYNIFEDSRNNLWIATGNGLNLYDRETFITFRYNRNDSNSLPSNVIYPINEYPDGTLWIGTLDNGFCKLDIDAKTITRFEYKAGNPEGIMNPSINQIKIMPSGQLMLATDIGLSVFNPATNTIENYPSNKTPFGLKGGIVFSVCYDFSGNLWVATSNSGGIQKRISKKEFNVLRSIPNDSNSLSGNRIRSLLEDSRGTLWIGTSENGINIYNSDNKTFKHIKDNDPNLASNNITSICEDHHGKIWFGTWDGGISIFDYETESLHRIVHKHQDKTSLYDNIIQFIFKDKNNDIWIGYDKPAISRYDEKNNKFITYVHDPSDNESLNWGGLQSKAYYIDQTNKFWLGTWGGLNYFDPKTGKVKRFVHSPSNSNSLSDSRVLSLYGDKGILWIGTYSGGLDKLNIETGKFEHYTVDEGLSNNTIYCILPDDLNNLWLTTNNGLSKFNPTKKTFRNYYEQDGLPSNQFFWGGGTKCRDGNLILGTVNGMVTFDPEAIVDNKNEAKIAFTSFKIFYKEVKPGTKGSPIRQSINHTEKIKLSYSDYIIGFGFTALEFTNPEKNQLAYKMEGFDKEWIKTTSGEVTYMNLPAGKYTFKVKAANSDGIWSGEYKSIDLVIVPPLWKRLWFQILLIVLFVLFITLWYQYRLLNIKKQKIHLEKIVRERTAEVIFQKEEIQAKAELLKKANDEIMMKNAELEQQKEEIEAQRDNIELQNAELQQQKEEIQAQSDEIEKQRDFVTLQRDKIAKQNKAITDSIVYAKRIQAAVFPDEKSLKDIFAQSFVFFKPRDIVSGDFYWVKRIDHYDLVAVADCTGHGVPGAFVSIMGINFLNEIINFNIRQKGDYSPRADKILEMLRQKVKESLNQKGLEYEQKDGLDIALSIIDRQTQSIQFSGAYNSLYYFSNGNFNEIKATKNPIGIHIKEKKFDNHEFGYNDGDVFYMFSDGYFDQIGGRRGRKFLIKNFKELLINIHEKPMPEQKEIIVNKHEQWISHENKFKTDYPQVDDILVMGFKI